MNNETKKCICGSMIKVTTQLCYACRRRYCITDIEMWLAATARPWLVKSWANSDWITEERDEWGRH